MVNDDIFGQLIDELSRATPALGRLAQNEDAFRRILKAFEAHDAQTVRKILDDLRLAPYCIYICRWLCIWHCWKVCRILCHEIPDDPFEIPDLHRYAQNLAALTDDAEASKQLLEAVVGQDAETFNQVLDQFKLQPYCFLICYWICHLHCRRFCYIICPPLEIINEVEPLEEFLQTATAVAKLAEKEEHFELALKAFQSGDVPALQELFTQLELFPCIFICRWFCYIHCYLICQVICIRIPRRFTVPELREHLLGWQKLVADRNVLEELVVAFQKADQNSFMAILDEFGLQRYCFLLCHWICHIHCGLFCRLVCPPVLVCRLDEPVGCVSEEVLQQPPALVVAVHGTAAGADFDHYTLEWSTNDVTYHGTQFHYPPIPPGGGTQGNSPVTNGFLAYFDTTALDADDYFLRLTVFTERGATRTCKTRFSLFKQDVRILGINNVTNLDKPALDPTARFVETFTPKCSSVGSLEEVSFSRCIEIKGSAFVGGCDEKKIKRYTIAYKPGHETDCATGGWTQVWKVEYNTIWQYRDKNMRQDTDTLTAKWVKDCVIPVFIPPYCLLEVPEARLEDSCWGTRVSGCELSGLYTLRLDVEDVNGNHYCDLQRVWLDNKPIHAQMSIGGVEPCADLNLSSFVEVVDCTVPWPLPLVGIAYDEYIDESLSTSQRPNDNFDHYWIKVSKQGGPEIQIPIDAPDGTCFFGTQRVGEPANRCDSSGGVDAIGNLADFDLRALDPICKANTSYASSIPSSFTLPRGECCVYTFRMRVFDNTKGSSGVHVAEALWSVKICNDL